MDVEGLQSSLILIVLFENTISTNNKRGPGKLASHFSEIPFPDTHIHHKKFSVSDCLKKLHDCDSFADLKHECEVQSMYMDALYGAERTCKATSLPC